MQYDRLSEQQLSFLFIFLLIGGALVSSGPVFSSSFISVSAIFIDYGLWAALTVRGGRSLYTVSQKTIQL